MKSKETIDLCTMETHSLFLLYYCVKLVISHVTFIKRHLSWLILGSLLCDSSAPVPVPKRTLITCPSLRLQEAELDLVFVILASLQHVRTHDCIFLLKAKIAL